ncbi:DoxX family protein [Solitalea sp. MAHUQ-68]|uniref:DoxX family protein n=1 Tax=Solitalea agri TaxID=2953739 RepID=A0A9X2EZU8_9SPHI|nr:DoxX family protein [Solitalea agri]MCO4291636.1 DoxX family protein [Solitalea agri]
MNLVQKTEHWGDTHHSHFLDVIRFILGLFIFIKGITFLSDMKPLQDLISTRFNYVPVFAVHYIAFAHLVFGPLLAIGLLTRFSAIVQIPILIGAVFFINMAPGFDAINSELWLSIIVLLLLVFFFISGSGNWSVDEYMKTHIKHREV